MSEYRITSEGGGEDIITASSVQDAVRQATAWVREGEWGDEGALVEAWVREVDAEGVDLEDGEERRIEVEIEPNHEALIREAEDYPGQVCGYGPDDHDWTSEGEGGIEENPGVWATGGTSLQVDAHCRRCGLHRTERLTGSQRNPGECDTVEYRMLDEDELAAHRERGTVDEGGQ